MKTLCSFFIVSFTALAFAGCNGAPTLACDTNTCPSTTMTYKTCVHTDGSISYEYGGTSCSCSSSNTSQCGACAASVATYCGAQALGDLGTSSTCSVAGTFGNTIPSGGMATSAFTGSSGAGAYTITIVTTGGTTTTIQGSYTSSNNQLTLTNSSASPSTVQGCIGQPAVYSMTWNAACSQLTLHKVSDSCQGRIGDADGATLTRQ